MPKLRTSILGASALVLSLMGITATAQVAQPNSFPAVNPPLSGNMPLSQRLSIIGNQKITDIARWYGWTKDQFLNELNLDVDTGGSVIKLDTDGRIFVVESGIPGSQPAEKQDPYELWTRRSLHFREQAWRVQDDLPELQQRATRGHEVEPYGACAPRFFT